MSVGSWRGFSFSLLDVREGGVLLVVEEALDLSLLELRFEKARLSFDFRESMVFSPSLFVGLKGIRNHVTVVKDSRRSGHPVPS